MTVRILLALIATSAFAAADEPELRPPMTFKDLTPPSLPEPHGEKHAETTEHVPADGGFFGTAEYLLLRPRRGAFDFAIRDPNRDLVPSGTLQSLNYDLRSGVRGGLGYRFDETLWDAKFEYTYFASGADTNVTAPPGGTLYATLTRAGLNDEAASAHAQAGLDYNVFDSMLGRRVVLDEQTALRLFGGFRFATIRQTFGVEYRGGDANVGRAQANNGFDGFGPLLGGELAWEIRNGFHVYARGHAALMTGKLTNPVLETNNAGLTSYVDLENSSRRVIPVAGLAIGGGWQHENISLRAGYEITNWFGLIDSPRFTGELSEGKFAVRSSDLSLEGFFFQVGLAY